MVETDPKAGRDYGKGGDDLTRVLTVLFAARWLAWGIAAVRIVSGGLPADQTRYEPVLLGLTFAQSLLTTLYVPLLRPAATRILKTRKENDLIVLGLADILAVVVTVYLAGGFRNPYEEYV